MIKKLEHLRTKEKENSQDVLNKEMIKEGLRWVVENKGLEVSPKAGIYDSPRISSEIPDCSMPLTFDQYNVCSLGCQFCFSYFFKMCNPALKGKEMHLKAVDAEELLNTMRGKSNRKKDKMYYDFFYSRKFLFHWGGMADPFCNFERKNGVGYKIMQYLGEENYPTLFSFKGDTVFDTKYRKLFERYEKQRNFAFQISMVTADDEISKKLEIGVPSPTRRLEAMEMLSSMGYWTILRLRPFIIGVTDETLDELLERALAAGMNGISTEFYALDIRSGGDARKRFDWMGKMMGVDNLMRYYSDLSPSERGGYRRLNRLVKERFVKKIYTFCAKHKLVFGCSDPDFKELCTSGSCCAMPDVYKPNPLLCNWTKNQLTYALKEARRKYHKTGERPLLHFSDIYKDEPYFYARDEFSNSHVITINMSSADNRELTYEKILRKQWNNLRSPASPVNYLHAKVLPCGVDSKGDIVYRYNPMPYEESWLEEGIDLTR